jgi:transcriptional regulator with XRE-family HTH domain
MDIKSLRAELGLSLEAFAQAIGVSSKGYASDLEKGATPSVKVALEIEKLSAGRIAAATLNPDVARVEAAIAERQAGDEAAA